MVGGSPEHPAKIKTSQRAVSRHAGITVKLETGTQPEAPRRQAAAGVLADHRLLVLCVHAESIVKGICSCLRLRTHKGPSEVHGVAGVPGTLGCMHVPDAVVRGGRKIGEPPWALRRSPRGQVCPTVPAVWSQMEKTQRA